MKYFPLVWAALWRKPARTLLTLLSVVAAFVLFGIMGGINASYQEMLAAGRQDRLLTLPRERVLLPYAYNEQIKAIPGVKMVAPMGSVLGFYQDKKNFIGINGVDEEFFKVRPHKDFTPELIQKWKSTRTGFIATTETAAKYGWKIGDQVPIQTEDPGADGSHVWTLTLVGTVPDTPNVLRAGMLLTNYDFVDANRTANKGTIGRYAITIANPETAMSVSQAIDKLFLNSPAPSRTRPEGSGQRANRQEVFDLNFFTQAVIGAGLFMLLFLTANVMMQAVRERIPEFGVLKTMGFTGGGIVRLILVESLILCLVGASIGLGIAVAIAPTIVELFPYLERLVPKVSLPVASVGIAIAAAVALLSALVPAMRAKNLRVVDALTTR